MILIIGQFDLHPDDIPTATRFMQEMAAETAKEHGCLKYVFSLDLSVPGRVHLSEVWESETALATHFQTAHMSTFRSNFGKLRVVSRSVKLYEGTYVKDL